MNVRQLAKRSPLAPLAAFLFRARTVTSHQWHQARRSWAWLVGSHEYTNFTYELTTGNVVEMAWFVAAVTGVDKGSAPVCLAPRYSETRTRVAMVA